MPHDLQAPRNKRKTLWLSLAGLVLILALIFVPPFISLNHYKSRVTQSLAAALGRPVRLSDVELRLVPRPGFLLTDLTVREEPAFGAEPVLHAGTVKAAIRFSSLWQGKLQISRISVDDASLNLVHMPDGRWNLESLFHSAAAAGTAAARASDGPGAQQPPYMEATNSRINIKIGVEKLPFSLLDADASMWRDGNGNWHVRLRGQPARTDVTLDPADTGTIRLEASVQPAAQLNQMPLHVDLDWRDAQLGQLSRLVLASDEGWRGDLTGELHLDGTVGSAKVQSRLRAAGVHRAEFAPVAPMDFDATCGFTLQYDDRRVENLLCSTPVGDGRARITGDMPGGGEHPKLTVELDRIPAQAALDLLRTMRSNIDPSLQAVGSVSGHMTYNPSAKAEPPAAPARRPVGRAARQGQTRNVPGPLTGELTVAGLRISGDALSKPIQVANMTLQPAPEQAGEPSALFTSMTIPAGGPTPLALTARLALNSFELGVHGTAALARLREFAHVTGSPAEQALAQLEGEPAMLDFTAHGPWVPPPDIRLTLSPAAGQPPVRSIQTHGTVMLKDANWKAGFLANPVKISAATLHMEDAALRWDPVDFSYGPVKGIATLQLPQACDDPDGCPPKVTLRFGALDASALQVALLGAHEKGTLLSTLLARITPSSSPGWPQLEGNVTADSVALGPFALTNVAATVKVLPTGADVGAFDAGLLGGTVHGAATLLIGDKPDYNIDAAITNVNPAQLGQLAGMKWSGGELNGKGKLEMMGYTDQDLGHSAKGTIHFDWQHGAVSGVGAPASLSRFDRLSGDAAIADGGIDMSAAIVQMGSRKLPAHARITFGMPAQVSFGPPDATAKGKAKPPLK